LGNSRVPEEIEVRDRDTETGNRSGVGAPEAIAGEHAMNDEPIDVVRGSGNVFRDFGYADADVRQAKALLGTRIMKILDDEGISTRQAEALTGVSHSKFSRIRQAKFSRFTIDWFIGVLGRLGQEVVVSVMLERDCFRLTNIPPPENS
jgi:predicted XRE-type DNA-binding protein